VKLKGLLTALLMTLSVTSFAQFFPAKALVTVLPGQVAAQVVNPYYQPIICNGQVFGQTAYGPVFNAFFLEQFLPAGGYRFAVVNALPGNPFIGGWANIHCRFLPY